jgi:hypothetical protein
MLPPIILPAMNRTDIDFIGMVDSNPHPGVILIANTYGRSLDCSCAASCGLVQSICCKACVITLVPPQQSTQSGHSDASNRSTKSAAPSLRGTLSANLSSVAGRTTLYDRLQITRGRILVIRVNTSIPIIHNLCISLHNALHIFLMHIAPHPCSCTRDETLNVGFLTVEENHTRDSASSGRWRYRR